MQTHQEELGLPRPSEDDPRLVAKLEAEVGKARRETQQVKRELEHLRATRREPGSTEMARDLYRVLKLMKGGADTRSAIEEVERMLDNIQPGDTGWRTWV
jgi:hypothetical protein